MILKSPVIGFVTVGVWLLAFLVFSYVVSVAGHVYRCALHLYASEGVVPAPYNAELMNAAWKLKKA